MQQGDWNIETFLLRLSSGSQGSKMIKYDALALAPPRCTPGESFDNKSVNDKSNRSTFSLFAIVATAIMLLAYRYNGSCQHSAERFRPIVDNSYSSMYNGHSPSNNTLPDIAWLMSFPNSGTSYTMRLVQAVSNTTAATNYAEECKQDDSGQVATLYDSPSGPYLRQQVFSGGMPLPKRYILTKTHCGGRCVHCIPGELLGLRCYPSALCSIVYFSYQHLRLHLAILNMSMFTNLYKTMCQQSPFKKRNTSKRSILSTTNVLRVLLLGQS